MKYRRIREPGATYFLTFVTFERAPIFSSSPPIERFHAAIRKVQEKRPFTVEAEVILPDHIHVLWTLPDGDADYPTRVRLMKTFFTKTSSAPADAANRPASRVSKGVRREPLGYARGRGQGAVQCIRARANPTYAEMLLDCGHPLGGPKAVFFERFGFSAANWRLFRDALLVHDRARCRLG